MDSTELAFAGIARQAELLDLGEVSSTELTELYLERIERIDPKLNCFTEVYADRAREAAGQADRRIATGERSPLLGVPIALKDVVDVEGEVTGFGTAGFDHPAAADGAHWRRLREAGAILIAKTTLPELAICGFTESRTHGVTRNPWDRGRTPGGSSGGSAAAVAAGLIGAASASDGAGSIRIPAANCGLFGLKPQRGRVSLDPDPEHWLGMSMGGCVSRRVADSALWLDVASGPEPGDRDQPAPLGRSLRESARTPPGQLRIAWSMKPVRAAAPPIVGDDVVGAVASVGEVLGSLGHDVYERDPDWGGVGNPIAVRYLAGIAQDCERVPHPDRLESRTRAFGRLGGAIPDRLVRSVVDAEAKHAERINSIFEDCDVLMTPTTGVTAIEVERWKSGLIRTMLGMSRIYPFTPVWNYTGQPAAAVPAGFTTDGLPLSVQLIAPAGREDLLVSLAAQIETETGWADHRPELAA